MADKIDLPDIGSLANSSSARAAINSNFNTVENAIDNTLSRDGSTPNQMEADIDLNGNSLLNVADPVNDMDGVNKRSIGELVGTYVSEIAETIIEGTARVDRFIATADQTNFTLTDSPGFEENMYVFDNGIAMTPNLDFHLTGSDLKTLTFFSPRTLDAEIVARYTQLAPTEGLLRADLANNEAASKGGALVAWKQSADNVVDRTVTDKLRDVRSVADWGVVGDGVTDESVKMQAAITAMDALGGGELIIPDGFTIKISQNLVSHAGVLLKAACVNDVSTNTNGSGLSNTRIVWGGAVNAGYMYTVSPAVVGNVVWGGGAEGIEWDGASTIAGGVHLNTTKFALFDGKVRSVTFSAVTVSSVSAGPGNFSQQNYIRRLEWIYGASAATQAANGLTIRGNGSTIAGTQQRVGRVTGLGHSGYAIDIAETDNCLVEFVSCAMVGTGKVVKIRNLGAGPANSNVFLYVAGGVDIDAGIYGTRLIHYVSEGGGITGTGAWDGNLHDYVTGYMYQSHAYKMRKKINIGSNSFRGDANTGAGKYANQWQVPTMLSTGTSHLCAYVPHDYDIRGGNITGVEIWVATNGTSGGNYQMTVQASTMSEGEWTPAVTPEASLTQAVAAPVQYFTSKYTFTFSSPLAYANGNCILLDVSRAALHANDTNTDDSYFLGARILFEATGPNSAGSGTYNIPVW